MAKELTANFSANSSGFSAAVQKLKTDLTNLNKSLDENKKAISETNKKTREYEKELELLKKAEKENGEATKEQKQRMGELETAIAQTRVKAAELKTEQAELKANIKNTTRQLEEQTVSANQSGKSLDAVKSSAKDLGKMLGTTAAGFSAIVGALYAMTASAGAAADDINTLSKQYGLSTEEIQKFKYATDLIDVSLETYVASIARNIRSMSAYQNGTEATVQAYDTLGVAVTDANGKLRDSQTVYNEVISALGKVEDETERDSIAMTILGRNAQQLNPLILGGADALAELGEQAENLGLILPQESLDNLNAFNDKVDTLKANMNGLQMVVGESFANSFDSFFEAGDDFLEFVQQLKADGTLDEMAKGLSDTLATLVNFLKTAITVGWQFRNAIAAGVVSLITFKTAINIGNIISGTVTAIKSFKTATDAATVSQQIFNATGAANPYVLIGSAIFAVVGAVTGFAIATGNAADKAQDLADKTTQLAQNAKNAAEEAHSLDDITEKYAEISTTLDESIDKKSELESLQQSLNNLYGDEAGQIDLVNGKYEEQIALLKGLNEAERIRKLNEAKSALSEAETAKANVTTDTVKFTINGDAKGRDAVDKDLERIYNDYFGKESPNGEALISYNAKSNNDIEFVVNGTIDQKIETLTKMRQAILDSGQADGSLSEAYNIIYDKLSNYQTIKQNVDDLNSSIEILNGTAKETTETESDSIPVINNIVKSAEELSEIAEQNKQSTAELSSEYKKLTSALDEYNNAGSLSIDTALSLINSGYSACVAIDKETGAIKLNIEAYKDLAREKIEAQKQSLILERRELNLANAMLATQAASAAQSQDLATLREIQAQISANDKRIQEIDAIDSTLYSTIESNIDTWGTSDYKNPYSSSGSSGSSDNIYSQAAAAYKTEADKKIDLIKRELEAKKELRDETIKAIDDEIEARKRLNEDNDMEKQINEVKAQLKYGQLDEFSREQLEKKLQGLYDQKAETEWQRNAQDRKDAANEKYDTEQKTYNAQIESINKSLQTVQQIMSAMSDGSKSVESIINNNNTKNSTANINVIGQAFTLAQLTKAIKDALMDDIVIK